MEGFQDRSRRDVVAFEGLSEEFGVTDEDRWHRSQPKVTDGSIFLGQVIEQFGGVQPTSFLQNQTIITCKISTVFYNCKLLSCLVGMLLNYINSTCLDFIVYVIIYSLRSP